MNDDIKVLTIAIASLMKYASDLSLRVETCRILLRGHGSTDEEFDLTYQQLKRHQHFQIDAMLDELVQKEDAERLRRLLESAGETKH